MRQYSSLHPSDLRKLKTATRDLFKMFGGQVAAADSVGRCQSTMSDWGNPARDDRFITLDAIAELEKEVGFPVITKALANLHGHSLIDTPAIGAVLCWARTLGEMTKESSDAIGVVAQAVSQGGTITAEEVRDLNLLKEVREAIEKMEHVYAALKLIEEEG